MKSDDNPFDSHYQRYDQWFIQNKEVYESELQAVEHFIADEEKGLEVGVGSGRFAAPLGIEAGIDPSKKMGQLAEERGIDFYHGYGENLPFADESFDFVLMVTTLCFLDNVEKAFGETRRVLRKGGKLINGFVDQNSPLGKQYEKIKDENVFYREAEFYSVEEVRILLENAGFDSIEIVQTIFGSLEDINEVQDYKEGSGEGGFVVIKAEK